MPQHDFVNTANDTITLGPAEEARRLWAAAKTALGKSEEDVIALSEALDFGLRAAEIWIAHRLQPVKSEFPATITHQLDVPDPTVNVVRDATSVPNTVSFTELVDLLSGPELACIGPHLHRGWEDPRFSCRRSRETSQEALGVTLSKAERDDLLLLAAYRNRLFRCPPPVEVRPTAIREAFGSLDRMLTTLAIG